MWLKEWKEWISRERVREKDDAVHWEQGAQATSWKG